MSRSISAKLGWNGGPNYARRPSAAQSPLWVSGNVPGVPRSTPQSPSVPSSVPSLWYVQKILDSHPNLWYNKISGGNRATGQQRRLEI